MKHTNEVHVFAKWALSSLVSAVFLVIWIVLQWSIDEIAAYFRLDGIDYWGLIIFQWLFAIATLIPIASYIFKNSIIAIVDAWRTIKQEIHS